MPDQFERTGMLFGREALNRLFAARVAVFGVGGVGGHCIEALCRTGVGTLALFDNDRVCLSNLNRQIIATHRTIGRYKVDAMRDRILEINPAARVTAFRIFYLPETAGEIDLTAYDYIVDAVDTITAKVALACRASAMGIPIISAMGAANKLDPAAFTVADIYETAVCPVARIMRRELRKRGVSGLKVVYSREPAQKPLFSPDEADSAGASDAKRRPLPASCAFVPAAAGLILAGQVVRDLARMNEGRP